MGNFCKPLSSNVFLSSEPARSPKVLTSPERATTAALKRTYEKAVQLLAVVQKSAMCFDVALTKAGGVLECPQSLFWSDVEWTGCGKAEKLALRPFWLYLSERFESGHPIRYHQLVSTRSAILSLTCTEKLYVCVCVRAWRRVRDRRKNMQSLCKEFFCFMYWPFFVVINLMAVKGRLELTAWTL